MAGFQVLTWLFILASVVYQPASSLPEPTFVGVVYVDGIMMPGTGTFKDEVVEPSAKVDVVGSGEEAGFAKEGAEADFKQDGDNAAKGENDNPSSDHIMVAYTLSKHATVGDVCRWIEKFLDKDTEKLSTSIGGKNVAGHIIITPISTIAMPIKIRDSKNKEHQAYAFMIQFESMANADLEDPLVMVKVVPTEEGKKVKHHSHTQSKKITGGQDSSSSTVDQTEGSQTSTMFSKWKELMEPFGSTDWQLTTRDAAFQMEVEVGDDGDTYVDGYGVGALALLLDMENEWKRLHKEHVFIIRPGQGDGNKGFVEIKLEKKGTKESATLHPNYDGILQKFPELGGGE